MFAKNTTYTGQCSSPASQHRSASAHQTTTGSCMFGQMDRGMGVGWDIGALTVRRLNALAGRVARMRETQGGGHLP